jgi:hypothetical protein
VNSPAKLEAMKPVAMAKAASAVSDLRNAFTILARAIDTAARLKSAARVMAVMRAKLFMAGSSPRFFLEPLGRSLASRV